MTAQSPRPLRATTLAGALATLALLAGCAAAVPPAARVTPPPLLQGYATPWPMVTPPMVTTPTPVGHGSSRSDPVARGSTGSIPPYMLRVDQVAFDARKIATAKMYTVGKGEQPVAVKITVSYSGAGQWGFSGQWALRAVGKSGVVYGPDYGCLLTLPVSDPGLGSTVIDIPSLSGWAGCWVVKQADIDSLVMFYQPPTMFANATPMRWFALR